jgi:hypothetical protein
MLTDKEEIKAVRRYRLSYRWGVIADDSLSKFMSDVSEPMIRAEDFDATVAKLMERIGELQSQTCSADCITVRARNLAMLNRIGEMEKALKDATHRIRWMLQYLKDLDTGLIEDELVDFDAALSAGERP